MLRIGVIGARRARQGIGFHLARFCAAAGADVVAVVGTSDETARAAARALADLAEPCLRPRAFADAAAMVEAERPDALVVASPSQTHERHLRLALRAGLHTLCEKPLCWGGPDAVAAARELAAAFLRRGLHLRVDAQWPYTLDAYRRLWPGALAVPPRTFAMRLSPRSHGPSMLPDALPHALSLLAAVLPHPAPSVLEPVILARAPGDRHLQVAFVYAAGDRRVRCEVELVTRREQPREAGYGFDGRFARRRVDLGPGRYRLSLEGGGRRVPLPDPTPRLVRAWLAGVSAGPPPAAPDPAAWPGPALLQAVADGWEARRVGAS